MTVKTVDYFNNTAKKTLVDLKWWNNFDLKYRTNVTKIKKADRRIKRVIDR